MGNENSAYPKPQHGKAAKVVSSTNQPQHVQKQRKASSKTENIDLAVYPDQQHGKKPELDDDTFTNYIKRAKYKIRSMTNIGHHEEKHNPAPDVGNYGDNNKKENEGDHFSHFIQNARKKMRTVTTMRKNNSLKRGQDSEH